MLKENKNKKIKKMLIAFKGNSFVVYFLLGPVYMGPDKFLHGRILFLDRLFTWIRANSVAVVFTRIRADQSRHLIPGHNRRYLSKNLRGSGVYTSPYEYGTGQKLDLLFSGLKLAHLVVQKFFLFRRSHLNARWNRASFCPCPGPCKRGLR